MPDYKRNRIGSLDAHKKQSRNSGGTTPKAGATRAREKYTGIWGLGYAVPMGNDQDDNTPQGPEEAGTLPSPGEGLTPEDLQKITEAARQARSAVIDLQRQLVRLGEYIKEFNEEHGGGGDAGSGQLRVNLGDIILTSASPRREGLMKHLMEQWGTPRFQAPRWDGEKPAESPPRTWGINRDGTVWGDVPPQVVMDPPPIGPVGKQIIDAMRPGTDPITGESNSGSDPSRQESTPEWQRGGFFMPSGAPIRVPPINPVETPPTASPPAYDGPVCPRCGGMMRRTGSCFSCSACGHNDGCG